MGKKLAATSTFIVADDHPLFREALIHAIRNCLDDALQGVEAVGFHDPGVVDTVADCL